MDSTTLPPAAEAPTAPPASPRLLVNDLLHLNHEGALEAAEEMGLRLNPTRSKIQVLVEGCKKRFQDGYRVEALGILRVEQDSSGHLRYEENNFLSTALDIYVSSNFIRRYKLRSGMKILGRLRAPREKEKLLALDQILEIDGVPLQNWQEPKPFDSLTPLFPKQRIILDTPEEEMWSGRVIDLIAPLGKGQRGLIVAPPRVGKTILLKHIAKAIRKNHPEIELLILLVDERPEEVTDLKREVNTPIYSSTFDENPVRHTEVAELVLERAKRLVELRKDVVILLDSLTRLGRGYNNLAGNKGRLMSGGVDPKALQKMKRFFGAARNVEEGGSLTILASALVDTGSKADQLIFEEFKGTGNMEVHLDRSLSEKRVFPAVHVIQSGTRNEDQLYHPDEMQRVMVLRKTLKTLPPIEAMEILVKNIQRTRNNAELLLTGLKTDGRA
jgi:transcription termination factor Rho